MKIKIYDNGITNCRELWIGDTLQVAVNVQQAIDKKKYGFDNYYTLTVGFAPWQAGKTHMNTEWKT